MPPVPALRACATLLHATSSRVRWCGRGGFRFPCRCPHLFKGASGFRERLFSLLVAAGSHPDRDV